MTTKLSAELISADAAGAAKGADIASATTPTIGVDGGYFDVTGTTTITSFVVAAGRRFTLQFDGILTLTHGGSLNLPGSANITTAAGDVADCVSTASNVVIVISFNKESGEAVTASTSIGKNYIIDGDFTQWPEGTTRTAPVSGKYGPALYRCGHSNGGLVDVKQSTDVPTVAQSGHQSAYSLHLDVTTADDSPSTFDIYGLEYFMTGSDFASLHQQTVTLSFWVKATKTGIYCQNFRNSAVNRSYISEYTINSTNTWEKKIITVDLDTGGAWLFTEADKGLNIGFLIMSGSDHNGTAGEWLNVGYKATNNQVNGLDSTANDFRIAQVKLEIGSTATQFIADPIADVEDQVGYYVQYHDFNTGTDEAIATGHFVTTAFAIFHWRFLRPMRTTPSIAFSAADTYKINDGEAGAIDCNSVSAINITKIGYQFHAIVPGTPMNTGNGATMNRDSNDTTTMTIDARH